MKIDPLLEQVSLIAILPKNRGRLEARADVRGAALTISAARRACRFKFGIGSVSRCRSGEAAGTDDTTIIRLHHNRNIFPCRHHGLQMKHLARPGAGNDHGADDVGFQERAAVILPAANMRLVLTVKA